MDTALAVRDSAPLVLVPAMSIELAVERYESMVAFVQRLMRPEVDYGKIPGTDKKTLLKPGAEKLATFFGLAKRFHLVEKVEDWSGAEHDGEPFFYYLYRCALYLGDSLAAESDGSANSFESKYRYRKGERQCPVCNAAAILKSKEQGQGWFCWKKKGGCGATFYEQDPAIVSQIVGRVTNPDIADQVNTLQKMAQKRALVAATLLAVNASEFFTQDMEDLSDHSADYIDIPSEKSASRQAPKAQATKRADQPKVDAAPPSALDAALLDWAIKSKGERAGKAYYDGFIAKKSASERAQFAVDKNIKWTDAPAEEEPLIDAEVAASISDLNQVKASLAASGMTPLELAEEIARLLPDGVGEMADCTYQQIDEITEGLQLRLQQRTKAA